MPKLLNATDQLEQNPFLGIMALQIGKLDNINERNLHPLSLKNNRLNVYSLPCVVLIVTHEGAQKPNRKNRKKKDSEKVFSIFIGEDFEGKFSSINENAHDSQQAQNLQSQGSYRPGLLTQHSHHDDHTGLRSSQDQGSELWLFVVKLINGICESS